MAGANDDSRKTRMRSKADPIGEALRRLHDEVAAEPVPQEFLDLLDQIDAKLSATDSAEAGEEPA